MHRGLLVSDHFQLGLALALWPPRLRLRLT